MQCLLKFKDADEVIKRANQTNYGLAAGVLTNDINKALLVANKVKGGSIWLDLPRFIFISETVGVL